MIKPIEKNPLFLAQASEPATEADKQVITDLMDTLAANRERCVGMAANMIGVRKCIIVVAMGPFQFVDLMAESPEYGTFQGVDYSHNWCVKQMGGGV